MGAYLATPPLPWAYNQGGTIILRDKYVSLQDIINGAVVFQVQDNHGSVSNAAIVQYPSDQKYYLQASGSMLWQLGDISQAVNRIELIATGNIPQGYSLVGVTVQEPAHHYLVEIYADAECTQRPQVGQEYVELYAKFADDFNARQNFAVQGSSDFECFEYLSPYKVTEGRINLWIDWTLVGILQSDPIAGTVQELINESPGPIDADAVFSFG